jgi:hypothetical protein
MQHKAHEEHHHGSEPSHVHAVPGGQESEAIPPSLNRLTFSATLHCLTGCAVGEVLGMVIGTALKWGPRDQKTVRGHCCGQRSEIDQMKAKLAELER